MSNYYKRFRFWVEDVHGNILTKDLVPREVSVLKVLSGPSQIEFKVSPSDASVQMPDGSGPILFKPWGHWIHAVKVMPDGNEKIWASGIVQPSDVDPNNDVMTLKAEGFSQYLKGIPWLENWNPISVDPFEIVHRIWTHAQSYTNANLGVTVYPVTSGTQMLPGFSFQGEQFIQDFFAIFIRSSDRNDCGDYVNKIARDIPFDYWEEAVYDPVANKINKKIRLGYPYGGTIQNGLIFRLGENVKTQTQKIESEINWLSDITIKGYFPGKEYSSTISNADPDRYRRVMDEQDLHIDSNERAAAWGHKRLTRRQIPHYFESITVDPYHPNAPFGTYDVGDFVRVQGPMAWHGPVNLMHKIMMMGFDESKGTIELKLMAQGAFNYDPIEYVPPGGTP